MSGIRKLTFLRGKKPLGTFPLGTGISLMTSLDTTSSLLATRYTGDTRHDCTLSQETAAVYCLVCWLQSGARLSALIRAVAVIGGGVTNHSRAHRRPGTADHWSTHCTVSLSAPKLGLNLGVCSLAFSASRCVKATLAPTAILDWSPVSSVYNDMLNVQGFAY